MTKLARYEAVARALAEIHSVDEVKEIHDQAAAMEAYGRQSKDTRLIDMATKIRMRAIRRLGELMEAQREAGLMAKGGWPAKSCGSESDPQNENRAITLAEAGIDKHLAHRARQFAARTDEEFETFIGKALQKVSDGLEGRRANRTGFTADNEWFTPPEYLEAVRAVLGEIDLDPASHRVAQATVRAKEFFTPDDDGLSRPWHGRVFLNPPYAQPLISDFINKLTTELSAGRVTEAILLTHNYSDTAWFHQAAGHANGVCFTRGRIRFVALDGGIAAPTQGQTFFYFGKKAPRFVKEFRPLGLIYGGTL